MARKRRKVQEAGSDVPQLSISSWSPSSPSHPPTHVVYAGNPQHARSMVMTFRAPFAARKFIDMILDGHDFKWIKDKFRNRDRPHILTDDGVVVSSDQLEELMEYEYTKDEDLYELPTPYPAYAFSLRREEEPETIQALGVGVSPNRSTGGKATPAIAASRGLISVTEIARKVGIEPSEARAILRRRKIPKPPGGWAWPPAEADEIEATLRKG